MQAGAEVPFLRPKYLATDTAHSPDVVEHAINFIEKEETEFLYSIMLQPTSPFRTYKHIDEAVEKYLSEHNDSLISIKKTGLSSWWMFKKEGKMLKPAVPFDDNTNVFNLERQEFPKVFRPNGAIYITKRALLRDNGDQVNPNSCGFWKCLLKTQLI